MSNYVEIFKTAMMVFPFVALLFTMPYVLFQYHKYGSINKFRSVIIYSFILYMMTVYFLVIMPLPTFEEVAAMKTKHPRLEPFAFIGDIIRDSEFDITNPSTYKHLITDSCIYTVVFNVFMTLPLGMYLRYYFKCGLKKTIMLAFLFSLFLETTQLTGLYGIYPKAYRLFDLDDLMVNTFGSFLGYLIAGKATALLPSREAIDNKAFIDGMKVSGYRRIVVSLLDLFIFANVTFIATILFSNLAPMAVIAIMMFAGYYIAIPYLWDGKTVAGSFLRVRIDVKENRLKNLTLKAVYSVIYNIVLFLIFTFGLEVINVLFFIFGIRFFIVGAVMLGIVMLAYFISFVKIATKNISYSDKLFKISYVSTISGDSNIALN